MCVYIYTYTYMRKHASEGKHNEEKAKFNIEKIAKKIKAEHVVKKLLYKYMDPLIVRRTSLFPKHKKESNNRSMGDICKHKHELNNSGDGDANDSNNNGNCNSKDKVHYKNIRLQNTMFKLYNPLPQEVFPFVPKLERSFVVNKKRPYHYILNSNNVSNEIDKSNNDMFQKTNFSKIMKVSSICHNTHNEHSHINNINNNISFK